MLELVLCDLMSHACLVNVHGNFLRTAERSESHPGAAAVSHPSTFQHVLMINDVFLDTTELQTSYHISDLLH